jgi:hypothetical protein
MPFVQDLTPGSFPSVKRRRQTEACGSESQPKKRQCTCTREVATFPKNAPEPNISGWGWFVSPFEDGDCDYEFNEDNSHNLRHKPADLCGMRKSPSNRSLSEPVLNGISGMQQKCAPAPCEKCATKETMHQNKPRFVLGASGPGTFPKSGPGTFPKSFSQSHLNSEIVTQSQLNYEIITSSYGASC